jgi:CheY-like chemotaxis protein
VVSDYTILHVEDSDDDAFLLDRALTRSGAFFLLRRVKDGMQAIDYLQGTGQFADRDAHPFPALVLLDLKLPQMDGFDVLAWTRARPVFAHLPIFVLSSSDLPEDVSRATSLGARDYFVKSARFKDVVEAVARHLGVVCSEPVIGTKAGSSQKG